MIFSLPVSVSDTSSGRQAFLKKNLRGGISANSEHAGLPPVEFRGIVGTVQRGEHEAGSRRR
jgi:hypothetical protein